MADARQREVDENFSSPSEGGQPAGCRSAILCSPSLRGGRPTPMLLAIEGRFPLFLEQAGVGFEPCGVLATTNAQASADYQVAETVTRSNPTGVPLAATTRSSAGRPVGAVRASWPLFSGRPPNRSAAARSGRQPLWVPSWTRRAHFSWGPRVDSRIAVPADRKAGLRSPKVALAPEQSPRSRKLGPPDGGSASRDGRAEPPHARAHQADQQHAQEKSRPRNERPSLASRVDERRLAGGYCPNC